jgi:hypothetical protein
MPVIKIGKRNGFLCVKIIAGGNKDRQKYRVIRKRYFKIKNNQE